MFLFIFESIGTSELLLIGIVALIFLGPRKLPEMARKVGKMMSEFRSTTSEFKETWQREVNFEEEAKALNIHDLDADPVTPVRSIPMGGPADSPASISPAAPAIKEVDPSSFEHIKPTDAATPEGQASAAVNDKANWL